MAVRIVKGPRIKVPSIRVQMFRMLYAGLVSRNGPAVQWEDTEPLRVSGTIYKAPDGRQYLRLTDFSTSNGPDVHVVLAQSGDQNLTQEIVKGELDSLELGTLKGNQGDQNYDLPASVDLQKYNAVFIYCERISCCIRRSQAGAVLEVSPN
jgi:Electron transfer DM13